jgi:hypothetical protein
MNTPDQAIPAIAGANATLSPHKKCLFAGIMLVLLLTLSAARAEGPDDDYLAVYGIIDQADTLSTSGKTSEAYAKYVEAQRALVAFQKGNPGWNAKTVSFRLNYLAEKIAATSGKTAVPETSAAAAKNAAAPASKSPVKLLANGSEPRTVLRLHPAVGDKQTMTMTMKMAMATSVAGKEMPAMNMPAMVMTVDIAVNDVSAAGDIAYEMVFSDATVADDPSTPPAVAAAMKTSLAGIRGLTGTGRMSDHGLVKSMEIKLPAAADPQLSQTMDQMKESFSSSSTPLPEEAVGPGAKWEYKTRIKSQGMTIDQTLGCELVAIEGDRITLRTTLTQNAANQKIQNPAMPGLKVDLNKMTGIGTGSSTYDLTHLMPVTGKLDEKIGINMGMNVGQQKQAMDMKMDMSVTLESK